MDPVVETMTAHLKIGEGLFLKAMEGLNLEELHRRAGPDSSSMIWVAGHLVASRWLMLKLLGSEPEMPDWGELFARGSRVRAPSECPDPEEIRSRWQDFSGLLTDALVRAPEELLSAESTRRFPVPDRSVRGGLAFLVWHEAYHVGQMGFIRKMLGHASLVG